MLALYTAYDQAGFHLARQPRGEKSGLGHKPGDFEHYPVDAKGAMQWLEHDGNVSVTATGELAFLDVDVDESVDASIRETLLVRIRMALGAMDAFYHRSPRGGMHLLIRNATNKIRERTALVEFPQGQIDVKGFGKGYVIGPGSRTMDGVYTGHTAVYCRPSMTTLSHDCLWL